MRGQDQKRAERARSLRRQLTPAESALWARIRARQLGGFKFVCQEPIGGYYVDFVCRERRLIVKLDGGQHSERSDNARRDSELSALGYRVIRVWNNDVIENLDGVLQMLLTELEKQPLTPALSPQAGAGSIDAVRVFYERHPYPKPLHDLDRHRELYRNPDRRRAWSLLLWPAGEPQADREILVAGCGTSQAAVHALREPDAHVTAIDISEVSLRHTRELQGKCHGSGECHLRHELRFALDSPPEGSGFELVVPPARKPGISGAGSRRRSA